MKTKNNSKFILLGTVAGLLLVVSVIGATLAFNLVLNGIDKQKPIHLETVSEIKVEYTTAPSLNVQGLNTNKEVTFTFNLENKTNAKNAVGLYELNWDIIKNELYNVDFVYTLVGTSTSTNENNQLVSVPNYTQIPLGNQVIGVGKINSGDKHSYTLTLKINDNGKDQTALQAKTFNGKIIALSPKN